MCHKEEDRELAGRPKGSRCDAQDPICERGGRRDDVGRQPSMGNKESDIQDARSSWERNWLEVATELCGVFNGLSRSHEIALATAEIQKSFLKDRNARLKGLGNAWVPQVAREIMLTIKKVESAPIPLFK
jgi:hypothetical protein